VSNCPSQRFFISLTGAISVGSFLVTTAGAEGIEFFESKVRPLLAENCYDCHSGDVSEAKAHLLLDSSDGWKIGGESGPAIIPGRPDESLVMKAVGHQDPDLQMPPKYRLQDTEIETLRQWILAGAPDPRDSRGLTRYAKKGIDLEEGRKFWAFKAPVARPVPSVKNLDWPNGAVDQFILAKIEAANLVPGPDAKRRTLLRRAYYDLIGIPPSPAQMDAFLADANDADSSDVAFAKVVDALLARPEVGERWGRHWLDVTRFAESSGGGRSLMFPHAWRFRDYVIESFNRDKPYNELIREHLAGDLLPWQEEKERNEHLVASGYLVLGAINYELQDKELLTMETIDEQVSAIGRTFLGMTLDCARCHDHKFDPIPTEDYYALAGIFGSTESLVPGNVSSYTTQKLMTKVPQNVASYRKELAQLKRALEDAEEAEGAEAEAEQLRAALDELKKNAPNYADPVAMAVKESNATADGHVHIRGGVRNKGKQVPRGVLQVAVPAHGVSAFDLSQGESGRLQLADWIASDANPLTARVMVNRIWLHLMGQGIVRTPDNFGATGELPSHPELLDFLALRYMQMGWSTKAMIRELMLSRVYQLSSNVPPLQAQQALQEDPENRLFAHANRKRLQAEAIRDTMLVLSGNLDPTRGGRTIRKLSEYDLGYSFDTRRRSVYVPWFRNSMLNLFQVFDAPNPNLVIGRRTETNLPTQALYLINSPFVREQAEQMAARMQAQDLAPTAAYDYVFGRPPSVREAAMTERFFQQSDDLTETWKQFCQALFASIDFRYLD
jgi:hypothetical protein